MTTVNLTTAEKQVEAARLKLEQAKNRLRYLNAKATAKQKTQERKDRNRRLILTGAVVWNLAAEDEAFRADLLKWLDKGIPEKRNRMLFGLAAVPEGANSGRKSISASESGTGGGSGTT